MIRTSWFGAVAVLVILGFGAPARADRPNGGPPSGTPPMMHGHGPKNPPCAFNCAQTARSCRAAGRTQLQMCATTTCSSELAAVQQACAAGDDSPDCASAEQALKTCMQPCRTDFASSQQTCRNDALTCLSQCPSAPPVPPSGTKDPACLGDCAQALNGCLGDARNAAQTCRAACVPPTQTPGADCTGDGMSQSCETDREAAHQCLSACNTTLQQAVAGCLSAADTCATGCPSASPPAGDTPTPTPSPSDN